MDIVSEFVGACLSLLNSKDVLRAALLGLGLPGIVLQLETCQLDLENDLFSELAVDWDPCRTRLFNDFALRRFFKVKPTLISHCDDELALEPLTDFCVTLAGYCATLFTLLEKDDECAGRGRVVVTLHP